MFQLHELVSAEGWYWFVICCEHKTRLMTLTRMPIESFGETIRTTPKQLVVRSGPNVSDESSIPNLGIEFTWQNFKLILSAASCVGSLLNHSPVSTQSQLSLNSVSTQSQLSRLQLILNSTARAVSITPKCPHITPVLKSLHWLNIEQRIRYKIRLQNSSMQHTYQKHTYLSSHSAQQKHPLLWYCQSPTSFRLF